MNDNTLISVIVPAFQAAGSIERAVKSVLAIPSGSIEVIVVDDGSTDGTSAVLEPLLVRDPRLKLIRQDNRGRSAARNRGVREASGKWLMFLDSDDFLMSGGYAPLLERAENSGSPLVVFGMEKSDGRDQFGGCALWDTDCLSSPECLTSELWAEELLDAMIFRECDSFVSNRWMYESNSTWSRLYRRDQVDLLVSNSGLSLGPFPVGVRFSEDRLFNISYLKFLGHRRVEFVSHALYFWDLAESATCAQVRGDDADSLPLYFSETWRLMDAGLLTLREAEAITAREAFSLFQRAVYVAHSRSDVTAEPFVSVFSEKRMAQSMGSLPVECLGRSLSWRLVARLMARGWIRPAFSLCSAVYGARKAVKAFLIRANVSTTLR